MFAPRAAGAPALAPTKSLKVAPSGKLSLSRTRSTVSKGSPFSPWTCPPQGCWHMAWVPLETWKRTPSNETSERKTHSRDDEHPAESGNRAPVQKSTGNTELGKYWNHYAAFSILAKNKNPHCELHLETTLSAASPQHTVESCSGYPDLA